MSFSLCQLCDTALDQKVCVAFSQGELWSDRRNVKSYKNPEQRHCLGHVWLWVWVKKEKKKKIALMATLFSDLCLQFVTRFVCFLNMSPAGFVVFKILFPSVVLITKIDWFLIWKSNSDRPNSHPFQIGPANVAGEPSVSTLWKKWLFQLLQCLRHGWERKFQLVG